MDVEAVSMRVEMQTVTSKVVLAEFGGPDYTLATGGTLESVVHHEIKELGQHVLACAVTYRMPPHRSPVVEPTPGTDPTLQTFRKFYKFAVRNFWSVQFIVVLILLDEFRSLTLCPSRQKSMSRDLPLLYFQQPNAKKCFWKSIFRTSHKTRCGLSGCDSSAQMAGVWWMEIPKAIAILHDWRTTKRQAFSPGQAHLCSHKICGSIYTFSVRHIYH